LTKSLALQNETARQLKAALNWLCQQQPYF